MLFKYNLNKETFRCTKLKTADVKKLRSRDVRYLSTVILDKGMIKQHDTIGIVKATVQYLGVDITS